MYSRLEQQMHLVPPIQFAFRKMNSTSHALPSVEEHHSVYTPLAAGGAGDFRKFSVRGRLGNFWSAGGANPLGSSTI